MPCDFVFLLWLKPEQPQHLILDMLIRPDSENEKYKQSNLTRLNIRVTVVKLKLRSERNQNTNVSKKVFINYKAHKNKNVDNTNYIVLNK